VKVGTDGTKVPKFWFVIRVKQRVQLRWSKKQYPGSDHIRERTLGQKISALPLDLSRIWSRKTFLL